MGDVASNICQALSAGPKTLCNACGLFWATQGRTRPADQYNDDYERIVPEGQVPATKLFARPSKTTPSTSTPYATTPGRAW